MPASILKRVVRRTAYLRNLLDIVERDVHVDMVRENLDEIPYHPVPPGYSLRWYEPGDEKMWLAIWTAAERQFTITSRLYEAKFGADRDLLRDRQFFLLDAKGDAIGTMTAWFAKEDPRILGRINWMAILPQSQGKGLSKPLMAIALHRLRELGHKKVCAGTSTSRLAAINLNCQFGFVPDIRYDKDLKVWRELEPHLRRTVLPLSDDEARNLYHRTRSGKGWSQSKRL